VVRVKLFDNAGNGHRRPRSAGAAIERLCPYEVTEEGAAIHPETMVYNGGDSGFSRERLTPPLIS
jgi:hypothetical protein